MINTLSNAYGKIPLVVKAPYCTRASGTRVIRALTTRDILPYMFDNSIVYILSTESVTESIDESNE